MLDMEPAPCSLSPGKGHISLRTGWQMELPPAMQDRASTAQGTLCTPEPLPLPHARGKFVAPAPTLHPGHKPGSSQEGRATLVSGGQPL